jgi:hypothetical protein
MRKWFSGFDKLDVVLFTIVIACGLWCGRVMAQGAPPPPAPTPPSPPAAKYALTCKDDADLSLACAQSRRLQIKQDAAHIARDAYQSLSQAAQQAQQDFAGKMKDLQDEFERVKKENGWPATVQCDPNSLTCSEPPPSTSPTPKPAPGAKP